MSILPVLKVGSPDEAVLSRISAPVGREEMDSDSFRQLIRDMKDTKEVEQGVGIAAPQVGVLKRIIIVGFSEGNKRYEGKAPIPVTAIINPELTPIGEEKEAGEEGCLSVPNVRASVMRFCKVRCEGMDENGNHMEFIAEGFHARILQHECDHLDGMLFTSRAENKPENPQSQPFGSNEAAKNHP